MKIYGFNAFLMFLAVVFGLIGGSFILSSLFPIHWKVLMAISMFTFAFGCSRAQLYLDVLDYEEFLRRVP